MYGICFSKRFKISIVKTHQDLIMSPVLLICIVSPLLFSPLQDLLYCYKRLNMVSVPSQQMNFSHLIIVAWLKKVKVMILIISLLKYAYQFFHIVLVNLLFDLWKILHNWPPETNYWYSNKFKICLSFKYRILIPCMDIWSAGIFWG